jgi:hypothetical protein
MSNVTALTINIDALTVALVASVIDARWISA